MSKKAILSSLMILVLCIIPTLATTLMIDSEDTDEERLLLEWVEVEFGEEKMKEMKEYIEFQKTVPSVAKDTVHLEETADEVSIIEKLEAEIGEEKIKEINADIEFKKTLPDVVKAMPYRALVTASPEAQKAHLSHIDNFSISDKEKEQLKNELIDLWSRYPYNITKDDYAITSKIGPMIEEHIYETYWKGTDYDYLQNGSKWYSSEHEDLIGYACDAYPSYSSYANASANDPDNGTLDTEPFYRYYNHYEDGYWHVGGAPGRCNEFATLGLTNRYSGNSETAYYYIGLASHYLSDVGCPFHTGKAVNQAGQYVGGYENTYHYAFEHYVSTNWDSNYCYSDVVSSNIQSVTVSDPEEAVEDLAEYSYSYLDTLWNEISADPTGFGSDIDVRFATTRCIRETAKYNQGLVDYMILDDWNPWNDPESDNGYYIISDELQEAIACWLNDMDAPITGATVTTSRLQALISYWVNAIPMPSGSE
jgi:hypothetical protein